MRERAGCRTVVLMRSTIPGSWLMVKNRVLSCVADSRVIKHLHNLTSIQSGVSMRRMCYDCERKMDLQLVFHPLSIYTFYRSLIVLGKSVMTECTGETKGGTI